MWHSSQRAAEMIPALLGLSDVSAESLFGIASQVLGQSRADRCLELCRRARLSRRPDATGAVAACIAGTRVLGEAWWGSPYLEMVTEHPRNGRNRRSICWADRGTPDEYLALPEDDGFRFTILESIGHWIQDGAADFQWGRPVDYVDLNDPRAEDRIVLPEDARPGDRFVASFDPGARVWVNIVTFEHLDLAAEERGCRRGFIGSLLAEHDICDVSEAGWAWSVATSTGPVRLPGEDAGSASDPFSEPLDPEVARRLRQWATVHADDPGTVGVPWTTKEELWNARFRLGLPWHRGGEWRPFDRAACAAVDGDPVSLHRALADLR